VIQIGDVSFRMHHYGTAHTPSDLCVEVVQDKVTAVGDIAMTNRIANMDEGSYPGTFKYYKALQAATGDQLWVPGHGQAAKTCSRPMANSWRASGSHASKRWKTAKSEAEAKACCAERPARCRKSQDHAGL
jgi:glyoxylase-like metal-dependent hydrolase (beta-lactamase superfamily II)